MLAIVPAEEEGNAWGRRLRRGQEDCRKEVAKIQGKVFGAGRSYEGCFLGHKGHYHSSSRKVAYFVEIGKQFKCKLPL